jgi:diguanylate cyclase (GGDEF)-like protein/PAS domain S-box-containing protein
MFRVLTCLGTEHDWRLVGLAGIVCFLTSVAAVNLFHRARSFGGRARAAWLLSAGAATGCGVWATHFIAVLAYNPGFPVAYNVALTAVSLVVAVVVTSSGLTIATYGNRRWSAAAGGAVVGAGVACMHYLGMAALELPGVVEWAPDLVIASIIIGMLFGTAALAVAARNESGRGILVASVLLTLSIISHHFIAMGAVSVIYDATRSVTENSLSATTLSFAIAGVAAAVLGMCLVGAFSDRGAQRKISEQHMQLDEAINSMGQGLCLFDANNHLLVWNQRYIEMYRIDPHKVRVGCNVRDLLAARIAAGTFPLDPQKYNADLLASLKVRKLFPVDIELADGRVISVVNQPTASGGWVATHEDITERTRSARKLQRAEGFLDTIISNVPSAIVVKEFPSLRYVLVNRMGEKFFGLPSETIIGKTAGQIFPKSAADLIEEHDRRILDTGREEFFDDHPLSTPDGASRIVTTTRIPIFGPDGKPQYLISVVHDVTQRKRDAARIAHMAHHDSLTDLPNRAAFNEFLSASLERAAAEKESFAVLCLDLDRFKEVNDVFGHATGDALLRQVARRLETACTGAFVARLGGDEFSVISGVGPQPATAEALADRLNQALADDIEVEGHRLRVGLTIGVSVFPNDGIDDATLVANADAALYRAKAEERGSIRFFEPDMDRRLREKRALQHDLRSAIERNELELYYQPQALIGGEIGGFEALVRWRHPKRGLVAPGMFIPLAEESGLIIQLGEWILREACREAVSWPNPLRIAINLSPVQFRHGDLAGLVHGILLETGLSPGRLELEITEGVLIGDFSRALSILRRLKNLGVRIAMDDFGTGYSSLSYLQSFPFDKIKIDQAFIANLSQNPQSAAIIRAIIGLGRGLDLPVVAEGVETKEQLAFLVAESCDEVQGFLIGRPQPIDHYASLVGRKAEAVQVTLAG